MLCFYKRWKFLNLLKLLQWIFASGFSTKEIFKARSFIYPVKDKVLSYPLVPTQKLYEIERSNLSNQETSPAIAMPGYGDVD